MCIRDRPFPLEPTWCLPWVAKSTACAVVCVVWTHVDCLFTSTPGPSRGARCGRCPKGGSPSLR
eukprot:12376254-Alexandrium_andersonii.AAC.1